ncbi:hypothetical protein [Paracidobacterium acidisoli]|uniref:Glycine zipper domain-containing protein n=1 Tax=Paracidobacterium acidisoli TaxID=2303751 RepID=A0A372IK13_9BACT|nr:hypothetical protein [Paracidobacterium acidisoli]MBT9333142.1 hypothetical protein [Paracidobacterium acidisoli]
MMRRWKRHRLLAGLICTGIALMAPAQQNAPEPPAAPAPGFGIHEETFVVKLLSPLSTRTARAGDSFTASVQTPAKYLNAIVEGHVTSLRKPENGFKAGKPEIQMAFDSITWSGLTEPISAELHDVSNSQGVKSVDDEGHVIGHTSAKKRLAGAAGGAGMGALVGTLRGGLAGGIIGAVAGGVAGYLITAKLTSTGENIEFKPGSLFTLQVSDAKPRRARP